MSERERDRDRQTDRQSDRQTDRQTDRQRELRYTRIKLLRTFDLIFVPTQVVQRESLNA